ncbi:Type III pantothenate kinase [Phycisphaerae bacterium RAS1]|nr:Type III pantothenate kinase [Phycisphaerae bacterium RAS1]
MHPIAPVDCLLAVDIGNSRIGLAVDDGAKLQPAARVAGADRAHWRAAIEQAWAGVPPRATHAIVIGSVVPQRTRELAVLLEEVSGAAVVAVREDLPLPLPLDVENPAEVGVDRVCSAAAAYDHIGGCCAVASFGTATTIDCVSEDGRFLGGAILPGIEMCYDVLQQRTALLPRVASGRSEGPFGRNTSEAIANGVLFGAVGALREIVERYATALNHWPQLVLTGGNAPLIASMADFVDSVVPDLCLMGIALAYRKAAGQK